MERFRAKDELEINAAEIYVLRDRVRRLSVKRWPAGRQRRCGHERSQNENSTAAGKPAARCFDHCLTDQDRAMLARRDAGATLKTVAAEFDVRIETVRRAEWRGRNDERGRELLAADLSALRA